MSFSLYFGFKFVQNILHHLKIVLIMYVQQQKVQYAFIFCAFSWSKMVKCNKSEIINIDDFQDPS